MPELAGRPPFPCGRRRTVPTMGASTFDDYHAEPLQSLEAGDDVIVEVPQSGRGKRSGVVVEMPGY